MTDRVSIPPGVFIPTGRPPFALATIPIELLLDDAESNARRRLIEQDISEDDIHICLNGPHEKYDELVRARHRIFFDDRCRFEIQILQHACNIRNYMASTEWTGGRELIPEEWVSHGYMLGILQLFSTNPDRAKNLLSAKQSYAASGSRTRSLEVDRVIDEFRDKHAPPANNDIKCFGRYIGEGRNFEDLNIEVIKARDANNKIEYHFKLPGSVVDARRLDTRPSC